MTTSEHADLIAGCSHDWGRTVDGNCPNCGAALASTPSPAQPTEANEQTLRVVAEIRSRLEAPGYADADRVRTALLHVEAVESGKARTLPPSPVQGYDRGAWGEGFAEGKASVQGADDLPPERDATPDEAFELGRVAGYDEAMREGADDRLAQAEAVIAAAQVLADANQVDHSGHVDDDGEPCGEGRNWHDRWARDLHVILATYQQSPQAALNEVRAGGVDV